jgi:hypothetical protein
MFDVSKAIAGAALVLCSQGVSAQNARSAEVLIDMLHWEERILSSTTEYRGVIVDGERVVRARADGTASALFQRRRVNLERTPFLQWRWRIDNTLGPVHPELSRSGDDFPARLYVMRTGGLRFWQSRVLIYVWASSQPVGSHWASPASGSNTRVVAVDSGDALAGQWRTHSRDVRADWLTAFGEELDRIDAVAIMTDADNSDSFLQAWYADIRFTAQTLAAGTSPAGAAASATRD